MNRFREAKFATRAERRASFYARFHQKSGDDKARTRLLARQTSLFSSPQEVIPVAERPEFTYAKFKEREAKEAPEEAPKTAQAPALKAKAPPNYPASPNYPATWPKLDRNGMKIDEKR